MSAALFAAALAYLCPIGFAADVAGDRGKWTAISEKLVNSIRVGDLAGVPSEKQKTTGVAVDRTTGAVFVVLNGSGEIWRSPDKGKTFERIDGGKISGRCETGWSLNVDPNNGRHMACFMIYGSGGFTLDGGRTWRQFASGPCDYAAVDWSAVEPRVMLGNKHDGGGRALLSKDAGKTWKLVGTGVESRAGSSIGVGVVDSGTLLLHRRDNSGIERSTDDGKTWTQVSKHNPRSRVAVVFKGVIYWAGAEGLLVSSDKGKSWQVQGTLVDAIQGPFFGEDENHIVVVGSKGFYETKDGGKTWENVLPLAGLEAELDPNNALLQSNKCRIAWFDSFAWDPIGNAFYHSRMLEATRKYKR
jgi:photosystem II stability/assembly factor-like uncharacterized protein